MPAHYGEAFGLYLLEALAAGVPVNVTVMSYCGALDLGIHSDPAAVVDPESLSAPREGAGAVALVAGRLGTTRLIDNLPLPPRS